jgi:hypothetical protein
MQKMCAISSRLECMRCWGCDAVSKLWGAILRFYGNRLIGKANEHKLNGEKNKKV